MSRSLQFDIVANDETPLYASFVATMTHHRDIAFPTHKQVDGFNHHESFPHLFRP